MRRFEYLDKLEIINLRWRRISVLRWKIFDKWFGWFRKTPKGKRLLAKSLSILNQLELDRRVLLGRTHIWRVSDNLPPWYCDHCSERFESYPVLSGRQCPAFINTLNVQPNYNGRSYRPKTRRLRDR